MKYDKVNGNVGFLEIPHKYVNLNDDSIVYTSVTTLIGKYELPYDKEFWSKYKALERLMLPDDWKDAKKSLLASEKFDHRILEAYDIPEKDLILTQQNILDEWAEENHKSCERGTNIHAQFEQAMYNAGNAVNLSKFGIGGKFQCKKDYSELNLEYGVYPEYLIYYDNPKLNLHIAGQIDLLIKDGNDIIIGDYKTNKKLDFKAFVNPYNKKKKRTMKYPLGNLEDCNFNHYQLQLSLYAWMLQKLNSNFNIKRLFIYHVDHNNKQNIYEVQYLKDDIEKMLKHFAKQQMLEKQKQKYERINY